MNDKIFNDFVVKDAVKGVILVMVEKLEKKGYDCILEDDPNWGLIILADKQTDTGILLRRIKPFRIKEKYDNVLAKKFQEKYRHDLVEVHPYKIDWDKIRNNAIKFLPPLFTIG